MSEGARTPDWAAYTVWLESERTNRGGTMSNETRDMTTHEALQDHFGVRGAAIIEQSIRAIVPEFLKNQMKGQQTVTMGNFQVQTDAARVAELQEEEERMRGISRVLLAAKDAEIERLDMERSDFRDAWEMNEAENECLRAQFAELEAREVDRETLVAVLEQWSNDGDMTLKEVAARLGLTFSDEDTP